MINTAKPEPLFANPIDFTYPLVLALGVTSAGLTVVHKDYAPEEIWSLTRWTSVITVVFAGLTLWGVFIVLRAGVWLHSQSTSLRLQSQRVQGSGSCSTSTTDGDDKNQRETKPWEQLSKTQWMGSPFSMPTKWTS